MDFDRDYAMLIGGKLEAGGARFDVINPATEQVIGNAPDASAGDLDRAIDAARAAFPGWAATPIAERKAALNAMGQAVLANIDAFKRLLTAEQGKPHSEAEGEIMGAGYWLMGAASLDLPVTVNEDSDERYSETRHVPLGVVGAIAPWNFPMILAMFKVGPALLAGNTMVLKPSPFTPLATLKFGELVKDILPPHRSAEAIVGGVGARDDIAIIVELDQRQNGAELLLLHDAAILGRIVEDRDGDEIAGHVGRLTADKKCIALVLGVLNQIEHAAVLRFIVDRADLRALFGPVADLHGLRIGDKRLLERLVDVLVYIHALGRDADLAIVAERGPE